MIPMKPMSRPTSKARTVRRVRSSTSGYPNTRTSSESCLSLMASLTPPLETSSASSAEGPSGSPMTAETTTIVSTTMRGVIKNRIRAAVELPAAVALLREKAHRPRAAAPRFPRGRAGQGDTQARRPLPRACRPSRSNRGGGAFGRTRALLSSLSPCLHSTRHAKETETVSTKYRIYI